MSGQDRIWNPLKRVEKRKGSPWRRGVVKGVTWKERIGNGWKKLGKKESPKADGTP